MGLQWDKQPASRAGPSYIFTLSSTSQATSTFGTQTYQVRVSTTSTACFVKFGQSGVVADTTSGNAIGTNVIDYYAVTPGMQAAVISSGTPGTTPVVTITEMS